MATVLAGEGGDRGAGIVRLGRPLADIAPDVDVPQGEIVEAGVPDLVMRDLRGRPAHPFFHHLAMGQAHVPHVAMPRWHALERHILGRMLAHRPAPDTHPEVLELETISVRLQQQVNMTAVVAAGIVELDAMPDGPLVVHVVISRQQDDGTRNATELFAYEVEILIGHAAVIEEVAHYQEQIGLLSQHDIDDPGEGTLGGIAEAVHRIAADAAIEMNIRGMNEFDPARRHDVIVSAKSDTESWPMALFDTHIIVDWSARSRPSPARPTKDSIWWCVARDGAALDPKYARTRHEAVDCLAAILKAELDADRRTLVGFDFPFGYPAGVARRLTGRSSAFALWDWLDERIKDAEDNANNRFKVAEAINRHYPGVGPCWGRPARWPHPDVPTRRSDCTQQEAHPPDRRLADRRARGAKTVWQLAYAGSVGSQVLLGLPALKRLVGDPRLRCKAAIWPFNTGLSVPDAPVVIVEIYPSLLKPQVDQRRKQCEILDRAQVRVNAQAFASLDSRDRLAPLFEGDGRLTTEQRRIVESEEAWILGLGHEDVLRGALDTL